MRKIRQFFLLLNIITILVTAAALTAPYVHPEKFGLPAVMALIFPILYALNVVFVIGWSVAKRHTALLSLVVVVLSSNSLVGIFGFNRASEVTIDALRIATFNVRQMQHMPEDPQRIVYLKTLFDDIGNPDIVCMPEAGRFYQYANDLGYPEVRRIKGSSNTFISKFPVIASEIIDQSPDASLSAWYDVVVNADTIRVLMVYLSSNQITAASEELLTTRKFQNSDTWKRGLGLVRSYLSKSHIRARQSQKIREVIEQSRHPVIIGGDLNDIPLSFAAHTITNGMQDAFRIKGFGFGTTYAGSIPGLRIDYILTDHNFEILNYVKRKVEASDHYPVVTAVRIKDL